MRRPPPMNHVNVRFWPLAFVLVLPSPTALAVDYGFGFGVNNGKEVLIFGAGQKQEIQSTELGFLVDTARPGRVFQDRLLLSVAKGTVDNFRDPGPSASGPDVPYEVEFLGATLSNSFRFIIAPGLGSTFWIGPSVYAGYFSFADQDGKDLGNGHYFGFGPSLGVDARLGAAGTLTLEAAFRVGGQNVSQAESGQRFDGISAEEWAFRVGWLFGQ